jgi:hypothetical protein
MGDPRSALGKLMRGFLASLGEYVNSRLYWRIKDPKSTPGELVKGY